MQHPKDQKQELRDYDQFDRRNENEVPPDADYSLDEIQTNRFWNTFVSAALLIGIWVGCACGVLPLAGAVALSVLLLICAWLYRWLFASNAAAKLDENSAGSGKRVGPVTMGTIIGYLNDGFKW